jgi:predicted ATPase
MGIDVLGNWHWTDHYLLCLSLHNATAKVSYCNEDFEGLSVLTDAVFCNAKTYEDKLEAYMTKILSLGASYRVHAAVELGLEVLVAIGEPIRVPTKLGMITDIVRTRQMVKRQSSDEILDLPPMTDAAKLAAMKIITILILYAFFRPREYVTSLAARTVQLKLRHGLSAISTCGFANWAMVLCSDVPFVGSTDEGYSSAVLALEIFEKFDRKEWMPRVFVTTYGMVLYWRELVSVCQEPLLQAYRTGLRKGDIEVSRASYNRVQFRRLSHSLALSSQC